MQRLICPAEALTVHRRINGTPGPIRALLHGGTCVLYPSAHLRFSTLRQVVRDAVVSVVFVTTALLAAITRTAARYRSRNPAAAHSFAMPAGPVNYRD